ncbi:hypothetical protein RvY_05016 [Ramazzottius varieornatus]|uniref:Uncharacterized protein n=1 Tax=Ramazzottius varieornatus TaxID=947166 RepID=A0A1D1UTK5_RAMVA|nr:hypothetical protein RvY_05016 [Ramazzottius varieornatus]
MRNFVVQKYIERPFLCHKTKFDVRQWFLVVWHPLSLWIYGDCYLRFSSSHYTLSDFTEKVHLTNNAIQGKYFHTVPSGSGIPDECMWRRDQFIKYLSSKGFNGPQLWSGKIFPEITRQLTAVLIASSVEMDMKAVDGYELFGADFVLSENLKPWLIEINSGPDLSSSTNVTANLCPELIMDCLKVLIDRQRNHEAKTGKFRLVHQVDYAKNTKAFRERSGLLETMRPIRQHRQAIARSRGVLTALPPGTVKLSPEGTKSLTYQVLPVQDDIMGHYANAPAVQDAVRELRREKAHSSFQARSLAIIRSCIETKRPSKAVMRAKRVVDRPFSRISGMSAQGDNSSTANSESDSDEDSVEDRNTLKAKAAMTLQARADDAQRRYLERIRAMSSTRQVKSKPIVLTWETASDPLPPRKFNRQRIAELAKPKIFAHIQTRKTVRSNSSEKRFRIFSAARAQIIGDARNSTVLTEVVEESSELVDCAQVDVAKELAGDRVRSETEPLQKVSHEAVKAADKTQSVLTLSLDNSVPLSAAFVSEGNSAQKAIDYYTRNPTNSVRLHNTIRAMLRRYLPNADDSIRTLDAFYRNPMDGTLKRRVRDTMNTLMSNKNCSDRKEITLLSAFRKRDTVSRLNLGKDPDAMMHRFAARTKRSVMETAKVTSGPMLAPLRNILDLSYVGD